MPVNSRPSAPASLIGPTSSSIKATILEELTGFLKKAPVGRVVTQQPPTLSWISSQSLQRSNRNKLANRQCVQLVFWIPNRPLKLPPELILNPMMDKNTDAQGRLIHEGRT